MGGRRREITAGRAASQRFRVVPVWKQSIDRNALARTLALLAIHLDQQERTDARADSHNDERERGKEARDGEDS